MSSKPNTILIIFTFFETILNLPLPNENKTSADYDSKLDSWNESHPQNPEEFGEYFEGDLIVETLGRNGIVDETLRWDQGMIPYEITGFFPTKDKNMILNAINMYTKYTCISFRPKTKSDKDYISITNYKSGCWSRVGKRGNKQEVNLQSPQCTTKLGTPVHELMHAAGFLHEQNRNQRDDYVTINWKNIKSGQETNFVKAEKGLEQGYGVPYDFVSVMHYSSTAFSANGQRTISPKDSKNLENMGQRRGFSIGDIIKINTMYNCPEKTGELNLTGDIMEWGENNSGSNQEEETNRLWAVVNGLFSIFDHK